MNEFKQNENKRLSDCIKDRKDAADERFATAIDMLAENPARITREQLNALVKAARESEWMIGYLTAIDDVATDELKSDYIRHFS